MYDKSKTKLLDRRELLRIKLKSLTAEAIIIRKEENRTFGVLSTEMRQHRIFHLRRASRLSNIAYGLIRGRTMAEMEGNVDKRNVLTEADHKAIADMIKKYGTIGGTVQSVAPTPERAARQARGLEKAKAKMAERAKHREAAREAHAVPA